MNTFQRIPERNHYLLGISLSFFFGCLVAPFLTVGTWTFSLLCLFLSFGLVSLGIGRHRFLSLLLCLMVLGIIHVHNSMPTQLPKPNNYHITASVYGYPTIHEDNSLTVTLGDITLDNHPQSGKAYCRIHTENYPPLFDGASISFEGYVYLPPSKSGPYQFDFQSWLYQNGQSFAISVNKDITLANYEATAPWKDIGARIQHMTKSILISHMGDSADLPIAMLLGSKSTLPDDELLAFQSLGIAHVLSVSGLHVGLIAFIVLSILIKLKFPKWIRTILLAIFLFIYGIITGFSPATLRATIMMIFFQSASCFGRKTDDMTVFAFTVALIALIDPWQIFTAGFVLSFSATLGILLLYRPLQEILYRWIPQYTYGKSLSLNIFHWILEGIRGLFCVSLSAQITLLLPIAYYFHSFSPYCLLINLIIVPYVTFLLPMYIMVLSLGWLPFLGTLISQSTIFLSDTLLSFITWLSHLPHASISVAKPPILLIICSFVVFLLCSNWVRMNLRRRLITGVLCVCITLIFCIPTWIKQNQFTYIQFSDSTLLINGDSTIVIDTGENASSLLAYLQALNRDIDAVYITQLHPRCYGGLQTLLDSNININHVYLPLNATDQLIDENALLSLSKLNTNKIPISYLSRGDAHQYADTKLSVHWPIKDMIRHNHNPSDYSLVLTIEQEGFRFLLTGDISEDYEKYIALPCDVLKASLNATTVDFLSVSQPRFALISSSGYFSSPSRLLLVRLLQDNIPYLRSDYHGDITITINDGSLTITPYKTR